MQLFLWLSTLLTIGLQFKAEVFIYLRFDFFQQPWRILTAHWVHVGWLHCLLNVVALWCLPLIFPEIKAKALIIGSMGLPCVLSLIFYFFYPDLSAYAGFSGVLHGLYMLAALYGLSQPKSQFFAMLIIIGILLKLMGEAYWGNTDSLTAQLIGHTIFIQAHQWGALLGVMLYIVLHKGIQNK